MSKTTHEGVNRVSRVVGVTCLLLAVTLLFVLHSNMVKAREYRGGSLQEVTDACGDYAGYRGPDEIFLTIYPPLWFERWCGQYVGQIHRAWDEEIAERIRAAVARVDAEMAAEALKSQK